MHAAVTGCHCGTTLRKYSIKGCPGEVTHGDRVLFAHHTALDRAYRSAYRIEVDARLTRPVPPAVRVPPPHDSVSGMCSVRCLPLRAIVPRAAPRRYRLIGSATPIADPRPSTLRAPSCVYRGIYRLRVLYTVVIELETLPCGGVLYSHALLAGRPLKMYKRCVDDRRARARTSR